MPRVSRRPIPKDLEKELEANLWWVFGQIPNESKVGEFLRSLLTKEERLMLAKRLAILYLLSKEFHYQDIAKVLSVTPTTIGKMRLISEYRDSYVREVLDLLDRRGFAKRFLTVWKRAVAFKN